MLSLHLPEVARFWHAAMQHRDVANKLLAAQVRSVSSSIEAYHAVYIGGYAIECAFKALLLSRIRRRQHAQWLRTQFEGLGHNLEGCYDSLKERFGVEMPKAIRSVLRKEIASKWRVELRYSSGKTRTVDAKRFLQAVDTVLEWIQGDR